MGHDASYRSAGMMSATVRPARSVKNLPGPWGVPLIGNALQLKPHKMHIQFEAWARRYGPFYKLRIGSRRTILVVADHKAIGALLHERPENFGRPRRLAEISKEMGLPSGVFCANGETWRRQRRMVIAGLDPWHVKRFYPSLKEVAMQLGDRWSQAARRREPIDLQAELTRYCVDTMTGLAFGAQAASLRNGSHLIRQHLDQIFPMLFKRMFALLPVWRWRHSRADARMEASVRAILATVEGLIADARERMAMQPERYQHPDNLLEAMISAADQPNSEIDDTQVAGNVVTMLLGGDDTTANTIAWTIELLWENPQALHKASDEVRRLCGDGRDMGLDDIGRLDYVEACLHEAMRLKPVAPFIGFQALHDCQVGDIDVAAGTVIVSLTRPDAVSEEHVPKAASFMPERWLDDAEPETDGASLRRVSMPFGGGPRICPGRYMALLEMKTALATLLARFDIESLAGPDGKPPRENMALTMAPAGLFMRLAERA